MNGKALMLCGLIALAGCVNTENTLTPAELATAKDGIAPRLTTGEAMALPRRDILHQRHPAIAYGDDVYLLVWQEGFNGAGGNSDILGLRLDANGAALDKQPIRICAAEGAQDAPAVAFCGGRFLVAWSDLRNGKDYDVRFAFVDKDGAVSPTGGRLLAGGDGGQVNPAVTSDGKDQFLAAWQTYRKEGHFGINAARIAARSGQVLDEDGLVVTDRGERPAVAWTGRNYAVCQKWYAALVGVNGKVQVPVVQLWKSKAIGWSSAAAAWGKAFLFFDTEPFPDPWGWGGNGSIIGVSLAPDGTTPERGWSARLVGNRLMSAEADGRIANCLDAAEWLNHPGWPMGMRAGLKHTRGDLWPSGRPAGAFNGQSLLVVWPVAHMVDNRRLANRDLYLARVLPSWGMVDRPPVRLVAGPTEETDPVLCAGGEGQAMLAYVKVAADGVGVEYRLIDEQPDKAPPKVAYVVPKSDTEMIVAFDEPIDAASAAKAANFRIEGLAVKSAALNPDNRGLRREVVLTTDPPAPGKSYTLRVTGVKDRSPAANATTGEPVGFVAKPGMMQRGDLIKQWAAVGPLTRDLKNHPFDPTTIRPSPGDELKAALADAGSAKWTVRGSAFDYNDIRGKRPDSMCYANVYVYSDRKREVLLRLDTNQHNRAWLNGRLAHDGITNATTLRGFHDYTDELTVALQQGWNRLLVQVENRFGTMSLSGQLTDADREPIRDLTWQLERPAR